MVDILHIQFHPLVERGIAAAVHLPKAGDSWTDAEAAAVPVLVETVVIPDRKTPGAINPPVNTATRQERLMMRPARSGSLWRNSATCLVAVSPRPNPAKTPNMPTVDWIIPSSP